MGKQTGGAVQRVRDGILIWKISIMGPENWLVITECSHLKQTLLKGRSHYRQ